MRVETIIILDELYSYERVRAVPNTKRKAGNDRLLILMHNSYKTLLARVYNILARSSTLVLYIMYVSMYACMHTS